MPKTYEIQVIETSEVYYTVEADSENEARKKFNDWNDDYSADDVEPNEMQAETFNRHVMSVVEEKPFNPNK